MSKMKYKPYPKYKDSGVEWIGEIPEHWDIKRLKYLVAINQNNLPETTDPDFEMSYLDISNVLGTGEVISTESMIFENAPSRARRIPEKDDTIISTVRTYLKAISFLDNIPQNLIVSTGFAVLHSGKQLRPKFLYYAVASEFFIQRVVAGSKGVAYPAINASDLANFDIYYPDHEEQDQILDFIDQETSQINFTIEKYEKLIGLLKEKRIALISHAVTKGLDPDVKMKVSGVEWIGDIPEHWNIKKLKYALVLSRGFDLPNDQFIKGDYPVYGSNGIIGFHDKFTTKGPNITVGRSGSVGEVNFIKSDFWAHNTSLYVKEKYRNHIRYLYYLLLTIDLKSISAGSAVGTLNRNYIHAEYIALPSLNEQCQIADYIDQETSKIDQLIEKIVKQIEQLSEYKTSLISHAVTGKIDVRGIA